MEKRSIKTEVKMAIINIERALDEKRTMQKMFTREHGCPSYVLALLITYYEDNLEAK